LDQHSALYSSIIVLLYYSSSQYWRQASFKTVLVACYIQKNETTCGLQGRIQLESKSRSHCLHGQRNIERSRSKGAHSRRTFHARSAFATSPIYEETPVQSKSLHRRASTDGQRNSSTATRTPQDSLTRDVAAVGKPRSNSLHRRSSQRDTTTVSTCNRTSRLPRRINSDDGTCYSHRGRSLTSKGHSRRSILQICRPPATARAPSAIRADGTLTRQKSTSQLTDFDPDDNVAIQPDITKGNKSKATPNVSRDSNQGDSSRLKREHASNVLFYAALNHTMATPPMTVQQSSNAETGDSAFSMPQMKRCSSVPMGMANRTHNNSTALSRTYHHPHRPSQTTRAVLAMASNSCRETGSSKILDEDKLLQRSHTVKLLKGDTVDLSPRRTRTYSRPVLVAPVAVPAAIRWKKLPRE
jgi:hypothetical protein